MYALPDGARSIGCFCMQADMPELQFGVAVAVILFSVSTILDELNLAFQSIVSKTVPGPSPSATAPSGHFTLKLFTRTS